ncbi:MAG: glycosyltransferase family 2 protein [Ruminococcus sp.]
MSRLSVVLPAYNEELMVGKTCRVLHEVLAEAGISYELVVVDDGSKDKTWEEITKAGEEDGNVLGVHFSRNFGKEAAVYAGMAQATGDVVAVMDCDLQHPPETLISMYHLWEQGWEVIEGVKKSRGTESLLHKESAGFFYGIMSKATGVNMQNASDFKMMDRKAVNSILSMPERNMFFRATSSWVGFKTTYVEFEVRDREAGQSKWSTWSLIKYAFTNIVAFTTAPLQFVTVVGGGMLWMLPDFDYLFAGTIFCRQSGRGIYNYPYRSFAYWKRYYASLGIIGYYIAKIYEEVKRRPRYIISQILRGKEDVYQEVNHDCSH